MGSSDGSLSPQQQHAPALPAPRPACATCWIQKKKCEYDNGSPTCARCRRTGRSCVPPQPGGRRRRVREWLGGVPSSSLPLVGEGRRGSNAAAPHARTASQTDGWRPSSRGNPPPDVLFACVSAFWDSSHLHAPLVHRQTIEKAFLEGTSSVYGEGRRPTALLAAMASNGVNTADLPGWSAADRDALSRMYADNAERLLKEGSEPERARASPGGSSPSTPPPPPITTLEAVQTLALLRRRHMTEHQVEGTRSVADRAWDLLRPLLVPGLRPRSFLARDWSPSDHVEWLKGEMLLRTLIYMGITDVIGVLYAGSTADLELYEHGELPLPCSDVVFDMPAEDAYALLFLPGSPLPRAFVDPAPLLAAVPYADAASAIVRDLIGALFELRAGRQAVVLVWTLLGHLVCRLRDSPGLCDVDRVALASSDPADDTADMAAVRAGNAALELLVGAAFDGMPPEIGPPLAQGDAAPLLLAADALLGGLPPAHSILSVMIALRALVIAAWVRGDPSGADAAFFGSAPMAAVLESGLAASRMMEAQLALDPALRWANRFAYLAALKVGALSAAVASLAGKESEAGRAAAHDAGVATRYIAATAASYPAAAGAHAKAFRALLAAAGLVPGGSPEDKAAVRFVDAVGLPDLLAGELLGLRVGDGEESA